jgi:predicted aspartyl protease
MGKFRVDIEVANPVDEGARRVVRNALVDTGSELSWIPSATLDALGIARRKNTMFRQATGSVARRWSGPAYLWVNGIWTSDEVVFGEPGDTVILGARSLEGLNLRVDPVLKMLIDAGPIVGAAALAGR